MRLSLMRHAIAEDHAPSDRVRALTRAGSLQLEQVLDALCARGDWSPGAILHSPYLRTTQTAEAVARRFPDVPLVAVPALADDDLEGMLAAAVPLRDPLLVGHAPTIGMLLAWMVNAPLDSLPFERAGFGLVDFDAQVAPGAGRLVTFVGPSRLLAPR
jgi:phosphohistidine phosphatase